MKQQIILQNATQKALLMATARIYEDEARLVSILQDKGMVIITLDNKRRAEFDQRVRSVFPSFEDKWGKGTVEKIQAILKE
ncbi:hypothetical protein QUF72_06815 [Desulfobacterales bacterium HSG2]|nr:hypothetical protein [Desulfobacterales bacterium HSG2]